MEDALGEKVTAIALTAAGRNRGQNLARNWHLTKVTFLYLNDIVYKLRLALGKDGTRLCLGCCLGGVRRNSRACAFKANPLNQYSRVVNTTGFNLLLLI